jgi:TonB family protein
MQTLFSGSLESLSWLINYTKDVSILICLIFVIKLIAAKRLPAWWSYSLWLILLVRMFIPWRFEYQLNISNVVPTIIPGNEAISSWIKETAVSSSPQGWTLSFDKTLLFLWLAGAIVLGVYILAKNIRFWIMIKGRAAVTDKRTLDLLEECKERLNIRRTADVIITEKVKSPALFGYFHPRLLLPEGILEHFSNEELTYVFMHEMGHLKRHDIAVSCLVTLFQVVHWFNPLVWFAFYQMRIDQESACDASVLSRLRHHQSVEYANAIVGFLERYCQNRQLPSMAGILENKTQMKRRLTMIVNYKKYSKGMTAMAVALLLATGLIFFTITGFAQEINKSSKVPEFLGEEVVTTAELRTNLQGGGSAQPSEFLPEEEVAIEVATPEGDVVAPEFSGGPNALREWLSSRLMYPAMMQIMQIQGPVVVEFTVNTDGKISDVTIVKSIHKIGDSEAIRVVTTMPDWIPAESDGVKVVSKYFQPIRFILK